MADIVNSYDRTEELIRSFPVEHFTSVKPGMETYIQNRLLTGFENWNRGFDAWKAWGDILYTGESIYNVHGARLTLAQYQAAMNIILRKTQIDMGAFHNMLICDDWCAIYYDIATHVGENVIPGSVMEFVKFKDYSTGGPDARVVEGWGGTKDQSFGNMCMFQGPAEKEVQQKNLEALLSITLPETDDLAKKYPVLYPTVDKGDWAKEIRALVFQDIDSWNRGYDAWVKWTEEGYAPDAISSGLRDEKRTMDAYRAAVKAMMEKETIRKVRIDSLLIQDDWAAVHYFFVSENKETGEKTTGDRMTFLQFARKEDGLKIIGSWTK
ncbi:MAG: nuclear transport factor 2 family protein [Clostridia bacterium]|nr:nuclear transport factor 2 family protein [Clostridia bacterium]